jgi:hypothetical protein
MTLLLTRVEAEWVLCFRERLVVDLGPRTILSGANAKGKSSFLRIVACLLGQSGESAASLVSTDAEGKPLEGVTPEIMGILVGDGIRYKITRRAKKLIVQQWEDQQDVVGGGSWRTLEPPDQQLARLFDRDSSPAALLDERLSDDKRIGLILQVAEAKDYDRTSALVHAFQNAGGIFTLQPIPDGLHPLEDMERLIKQVFDARTDVERMRKNAAGAAERLATGLTAEPPEDVADQIVAMQGDVDRARADVVAIDTESSSQIAEARTVADDEIRQIEARFQTRAQYVRDKAKRLREDSADALLVGTRRLAELRTTQEIVVADKSRRDEAEKARSEAKALEERKSALTKAINSLKLQAAAFVSDSFPGVRVEITEDGKRRLMVRGSKGMGMGPEEWRPWPDTNEARRNEIAAEWAVRHQQKRGGASGAQLMLVLMDRGETLDTAAEARLLEHVSAHGQLILTRVSDGDLKFEEA